MLLRRLFSLFFFFNDTATTEIYTLSLHDALPICSQFNPQPAAAAEPSWLGSRAVALAALALVAGISLWSLRTLPRTFAVADLRHFVGAVTPSSSGTALSAPVEAGGVLAATPPEFFPSGRYRWCLMLKAAPAPAGETLATVRCRWTRALTAN